MTSTQRNRPIIRVRYALTAFICLVIASTGFANAEDRTLLAPYVEPSTIAVAHIDLTKVQPAKFFTWIEGKTPLASRASRIKTILVPAINQLQRANVDDIYLVASSLDLWEKTITIVIPAADATKLRAALNPHLVEPWQLFVGKDCVVITSKDAWNRFGANGTGSARDDLFEALGSVEASPSRIAISLRQDLHHAVAAVFPERVNLSRRVSLNAKQLALNVRSIAIGFDVTGNPSARVVLKTKDSNSANQCRAQLIEASKALKIDGGVLPQVTSLKSALRADITTEMLEVLLGDRKKEASIALNPDATTALKQTMLAIHNFHDAHSYLPPRLSASRDGRPLLSWRVFILPYLGEAALYEQFRLDQPWDSEHNRPLIQKMPKVFALSGEEIEFGKTRIQVPLINEGVWTSQAFPQAFANITDGTSNTAGVVVSTVAESVIWTQPDDLEIRSDFIVKDLFGNREQCPVALFDGSARRISNVAPANALRALLTHASSDVFDWPALLEQ